MTDGPGSGLFNTESENVGIAAARLLWGGRHCWEELAGRLAQYTEMRMFEARGGVGRPATNVAREDHLIATDSLEGSLPVRIIAGKDHHWKGPLPVQQQKQPAITLPLYPPPTKESPGCGRPASRAAEKSLRKGEDPRGRGGPRLVARAQAPRTHACEGERKHSHCLTGLPWTYAPALTPQ